MKYAYLLFAFLMLHPFSLILGQPVSQSIQAKISTLLTQQKLAGAVWTVVNRDSIECHGAGVKNMETGAPISANDRIHVGSITKTIVALGILRLATENRLNIDDPIRKYLPDLPVKNPWEHNHPITVRHLLDHTSGLSDIRVWHLFSSTSTPGTPLSEFYRRSPEVLKIFTQPGTIFSYSNMGYTLLGMIIEAVVKEPYENYLDSNLLGPIGLKNSTFQFISQVGKHFDKRLAMGHFDNGKIAPALPIYLRPAGQFTTTALDMGILLRFMLNEGKLNGAEFINAGLMRNIGIQKQTIASKQGLKSGYAFGAMYRDRHNVAGIAHSGNIIGFHAMYYLFPEDGKAFFISHNMDSESADYEVFNKVLIDYIQIVPQKSEVLTAHPSIKETKKWEGYYIPVNPRVEVMKLFDMISAYVHVKAEKEGILWQPFQKKSLVLTTTNNRLFHMKDRIEASHLFYEDEAGKKYVTTGTLTLTKISGLKIFVLTGIFFLGILSCISIFVMGVYKLFKMPARFIRQPLFCTFLILFLLIVALSIIASQGIISIGDKTPGALLLYGVTLLLPVFGMMSLFLYGKNIKQGIKAPGFWMVTTVVLLEIVFFSYGVFPFAIWK